MIRGFHKCSNISRSHLKILDVSKAKYEKFHTEDPKRLGAGVEKISRQGDLAMGICEAIHVIHPLKSLAFPGRITLWLLSLTLKLHG